ncbi:SPOR domain-containing protein [uncultured Thiohalocapsa sp.]|uniref:SPOR domain-containing protein n=1 Tax=uncultured Thiohalocapsa sp. TaxID=768990 RepID=UPI0025DFED0D|nr:SPOR domain-containing protein [uncultured Thiohalocapsa sp.]
MDEGAKRRLVGAAVVVALMVIFVPMLVEQRESDGLGEPIVIPDEPEVETAAEPGEAGESGESMQPLTADDLTPPLPVPEPPAGAVPQPPVTAAEPEPVPEPVSEQAQTPRAEPAPTAPAAPAGPKPVPAGTASWVVQVASLGSPEAAKGLQDRLRAKGYTAFVEQATVNGKRYYRVRVGPEVERARADSLAAELRSETGNKPLVQRYP